MATKAKSGSKTTKKPAAVAARKAGAKPAPAKRTAAKSAKPAVKLAAKPAATASRPAAGAGVVYSDLRRAYLVSRFAG